MTHHSKLSPASAARRVQCPGSRALEQQFPRTKTDEAREGEAAHFYANLAVKKRFKPDTVGGHTIPATPEMLEGAELYAESIASVLYKIFGTEGLKPDKLELLHIEEPLPITRIHPDCFGTPDCWLHVGNQIHIWDYKFGFGFVDVFQNWQLIEYAAGILEKLGIDGIADQHTIIHFYIVQPRNYHRDGQIRSRVVFASDLRADFNILERAERESMEDNAPCYPGTECSYCSARHACPALQRTTLAIMDTIAENTGNALTPNELGNELRYLKRAAELIDARITGLSEQAISTIKFGGRVPFFRLEQSYSRLIWKNDPTEVITMGELMGFDLKKPQEAITPRQAIKMGVPEDLVYSYSESPPGAFKLVSDEKTANKIFGDKK